MPNVLLSAGSDASGGDKLWLFSGEFTSTIKKSHAVSGFGGAAHQDIDTDDTDTFSADSTTDKLYRTSGQFTSTVKSSLVTGELLTFGIVPEGTNTIWSEGPFDFIFQTSGHFTSTIKASIDLSVITDASPETCSYDGTHPSFATGSFISEGKEHTMFQISGIFSTTVKDSQKIDGLSAHGFNGTDTLVANNDNDNLVKYSGLFTSTQKASIDLTPTIDNPFGVATDNAFARLGGTVLEGDTIAAVATVTAALTDFTPIAGSVTAVSAASASTIVSIVFMEGTVSATTSANATLSETKSVAGSLSATTTASSTLTLSTAAAVGSLAATSTSTGTLTFSAQALIGTVTAIAGHTVTLSEVARQLTLGTNDESGYPNFIDQVKLFKRVPTTTKAATTVWDHNAANAFGAALRQIQLELGVKPKGNASDVADILRGIQPPAALTASDPFNAAIQEWDNVLVEFTGAEIRITDTLSSSSSYLLDYQVDGIPLFGILTNGRVAFGNHIPQATIHGSGDTIVGVSTTANADGDIGNSQTNVWINEGSDDLTFRVRYSNGTYKTGTVAVS